MIHCLYKVVVQCTFYCFLAFASLAAPDSTGVPAAFQQQLQEFRQHDDLEKWLYARIDYVDKAPFERIGFLMQTKQEAWRTYKTYGERLAWFNLLILQGYYQLQTGNILLSIYEYESALAFYEAYPLPDAAPDVIEILLKPLGNNYTRLADYNTALFIHRKTLALAQRQQPGEVAAVYSNMAICARWQGDIPQALQYVQAGVAAADQHTPLYGLLLSTWADVLTQEERYDTATLVVEKALQQLQHFPTDTNAVYWRASALQMAARIRSLQGKYTAAFQYAQSALQLFDRYYPGARQREKAKVNVLLGDVSLRINQPKEALRYYQQALVWLLPAWKPANVFMVPSVQLLYSENTLADALAGKAEALKRMEHPEAALDHCMTVFMAGSKLRAAFFYTESKLKELALTRKRADMAMQLAYGLWVRTKQKKYEEQLLLIAELSKAQVLADERSSRQGQQRGSATDTIARKVKRLQDAIVYYQHEQVTAPGNKNITGLLQAAEYDLSLLTHRARPQNGADTLVQGMLTLAYLHTVFERIPEDATVLEFFAGSDSSYMISIHKKGINAIELIENSRVLSTNIEQFMRQWFSKGPAAMLNAPKTFYDQCYQLYHAIFASYRWDSRGRYLLIPDGALSYLPFDALLTDSRYKNDYRLWPWLCKEAALSQAYSLQTWYQQEAVSYAPADGFTGFFVSKGKSSTQPVLSVMQEYQSLQKIVPGNYYLDSVATWEYFNQHIANTYLLHISSHAVSSVQDSFPYLQLYDQPFYLFDLRYRSFSPALVVLGACKTADGEWMAGEGVNSLSRGFTAAGAGGVVSGLWNVNDEAAISMVQEFYRQLKEGRDPAMALHAAKLQWLQQHTDNAMLQLPYYWAGLVYSGRLKPVTVPDKNSHGWYFAIGAALVLIAASIWRDRRYMRGDIDDD